MQVLLENSRWNGESVCEYLLLPVALLLHLAVFGLAYFCTDYARLGWVVRLSHWAELFGWVVRLSCWVELLGWVVGLSCWAELLGWVVKLSCWAESLGWVVGLSCWAESLGWVVRLSCSAELLGWVVGLSRWVELLGWVPWRSPKEEHLGITVTQLTASKCWRKKVKGKGKGTYTRYKKVCTLYIAPLHHRSAHVFTM